MKLPQRKANIEQYEKVISEFEPLIENIARLKRKYDVYYFVIGVGLGLTAAYLWLCLPNG
jgi:hypothetical protein